MRKLYTTFLITLLSLNVFAQAPNWTWAKRVGGIGNDSPNNIAMDVSGNVYVVGQFSGDTISFDTTDLLNVSTFDIFLVKYSPSGNVIWAKSAGGNARDLAYGIAIDANSSVYITGFFKSSTLTFDTFTLHNSSSYTDIFLAKYDSTGNVIWAKSFGGTNDDEDFGVTTDANSNVYLTGYFYSPSIIIGNDTLVSTNGSVFVAKFDPSGNKIWVKQLIANDTKDIATDAAGNLYLAGTFGYGGATIGAISLTCISGLDADVFVAKFDSIGNVIWAKSASGSGFDYATRIVIDYNNDIIIAGIFQSPTLTFGTSILTNTNTSTVGVATADLFLIKCDSAGGLIWARSAGGSSFDGVSGLATDAIGNIYLTGYFNAPSITFSSITLTNSDPNLFVTAYDSNGNINWARNEGGTDMENGIGICTDSHQNIYVCGCFNSPSIAFGLDTLFNPYSNYLGFNPDMFIAKLNSITGITESEIQDSFSISPNPFTSQTTITFADEQTHTVIKITDVVGKEIRTINFTGRRYTIEKADMSPGIYLVQTRGEKKNSEIKKIVIQ